MAFKGQTKKALEPRAFRWFSRGRGGQIRTDDFLLPKQALYQAELRPERRADPWSIRGVKQEILRAICNLAETVPGPLDRAGRQSEDGRDDRGALRSQSRDFPPRGKDPPNLTRVVPP